MENSGFFGFPKEKIQGNLKKLPGSMTLPEVFLQKGFMRVLFPLLPQFLWKV